MARRGSLLNGADVFPDVGNAVQAVDGGEGAGYEGLSHLNR